jgi:hypothetical protein
MALTVNNIGSNSSTRGVPTNMDNALEIYYGSVLTAFDRKQVFLDLVTVKTIEHGSSTSIPVIGQASDADTNTHVPGTELTMSAIPVKERVINIDALEYYALAVDKFEEKVLHFETRGELAKQAGEALAVKIDKAVSNAILTASQTSGTIGGEAVQADGSEVNNDAIDSGTTAKEKGDALISAVFEAAAIMEGKDVTGEKYLVVSPLTYSYLAQSDAVNKDITSGDNGGINKGTVMEVAGIRIYKSNFMPTVAAGQTSIGVNVGETNTRYVQALLFTSEAVAVAKLMDVTSEVNYIPEQLATLMTTYYSYGLGVLKPAASCVITGGDTGVAAV